MSGPAPEPDAASLREWDAAHYWHSFTPMAQYEPLVIVRGEGSTLFDTAGRGYLDAASSMWCAALGHGHPRVVAAIRDQLGRLAHCTSLGMGADVAVRLAKRLADLAPGDLRRVFFSSDGSSAVEAAMKLAIQYWRQCDAPQPSKTKFLALGDAYHGDTLGAAALGGVTRYRGAFEPVLCEVLRVRPPDAHRTPAPVSADEECARALTEMRAVLASSAGEVAAVVIEPLVQCAAGMLMHPTGFLAGVRALCDEFGVLLIADEIAVGLGRTGGMFACNHEGVAPDFLCLGKHLTAGALPMAATITAPRVYEAFLNREPGDDRTFWHGHTHSGNALAAAAALATLDELEENILPRLPATIARLASGWREVAGCAAVKDWRQCGMVAALTLREPIGHAVARHALARGVWLRGREDLVYVMPPLNISDADLDRILGVVGESIRAASG